MSDLQELYQQLIIDHGRHPRQFGQLPNANHVKEGHNPLCGDRITVYLHEKNGVVEEAKFEGSGCAISLASASLMMESIKGKTLDELDGLFSQYHQLVLGKLQSPPKSLGKLLALAGVAEFPMRVKCATLCWHTALAAMKNSYAYVTTE